LIPNLAFLAAWRENNPKYLAKTPRHQGSEKIGIYFTLRLRALAGENLKLLLSNKLHDRN
jgi:hypothetical protein